MREGALSSRMRYASPLRSRNRASCGMPAQQTSDRHYCTLGDRRRIAGPDRFCTPLGRSGQRRPLSHHPPSTSHCTPTATAESSAMARETVPAACTDERRDRPPTETTPLKSAGNHGDHSAAYGSDLTQSQPATLTVFPEPEPKTPTPLPVRQLSIVLFLRVTEPISYLVCFPFINQMLLDIGVVDDPRRAGFYAGIVSPSYGRPDFRSRACSRSPSS